MKKIELEIKALSPLAISRQKPGSSINETMDYIPGSVIRGAIAARIIQESGNESEDLSKAENGGDFQALFLSENPAIFQNAYPAQNLEIKDNYAKKVKGKGKTKQPQNVETKNEIRTQKDVKVLPTTAVSSKTKPGFKSKDKPLENNGVFDTLIDRFCAQNNGFLYDPNCPVDGGRVEPFSGFYSYHQEKEKYYQHSTSKRLLTRTGINRKRATSEEEVLYSIEVINELQKVITEDKSKKNGELIFCSAILVPDKLADSLANFIKQRNDLFRFGNSKSRGLGKVEITAKVVDIKLNLEERITDFNEQLKGRWEKWQVFNNQEEKQPSLKNRTYFTLDLQSDAILTENWQRTMVISPEMLQEFSGVEDSSLELHVAYSSYDYLSGWNSAWGLMKDVELITRKGGVYLFSTKQLEPWLEGLGKVENQGVGERTSEGFGQVIICDEFHLIFREEAV
ncbi:CRISPR-associated protein Csx10 [Hydrocoleum sp. CS-953]|uniref:type III-D CRISPR-associated RAMP protein Csx10 n=1 Tax=Hydrocoleum sp. CS-953 TaxID=1671698 RepID=UPI000B9BB702|nr:CRISPR-associated RAMP protein Csx10 [Hydrocoleum sp. CS-953]OZH51977.1 CRISPR-associated protein Csx10 [Hydrocoleum sp. CS-953]